VTTIFLQAALGGLTVYLVWAIAVLLFRDNRVAGICALLYAVEPLSPVYTSALLSETLFTAVMMLFTLCFLRYMKSPTLWGLIASAVVLAASVYVRPVSYYFPALIALTILLAGFFQAVPRERWRLGHAVLFLVISMSLIAAWQVRNQRVTGYSGFSSVTDLSLYFYFNTAIQGVVENDPDLVVPDMGKKFASEEWLSHFGREGEAKLVSDLTRMREESLRTIRDHPLALLTVYLKGMKRWLTDPCTVEYFHLFRFGYPPKEPGLKGWYPRLMKFIQDRPLLFWGNLLLYVWLMAYALFAGFGLFCRRVPVLLWVAMVPAVYLLVISSGPAATQRFRVPAMPAICLAAGWGLWQAREMWRGRGAVIR